MRHRLGYRKFSRHTAHRMSMMRNLAISLFQHGSIVVTLAKAKSLRPFAERLITKASRVKGDPSLSLRRLLLSRMNNREDVVSKMLLDYPAMYGNRPGGYIRIYKNGYRKGDCAPMSVVVLVGHARDAASSDLL